MVFTISGSFMFSNQPVMKGRTKFEKQTLRRIANRIDYSMVRLLKYGNLEFFTTEIFTITITEGELAKNLLSSCGKRTNQSICTQNETADLLKHHAIAGKNSLDVFSTLMRGTKFFRRLMNFCKIPHGRRHSRFSKTKMEPK